jgi:5-methylcytosine-specific restriction enzyme A
MPNFPKSKKRPWAAERKAQEGRKITNPFYHTTAWRKFRKAYITANPLCAECYQNDIVKPGNVVDHIIQINPSDAYNTSFGHFGEPLDESNVQTLCTHHHAAKSGRERWGK